MEKDFNSQFNKLKENIKLSSKEMDFHRAEILKFIAKQPSPYNTVDKKFPSPFYMNIFIKKHFLIATLAVVMLSGGGITISANGSLPNDYLYQVKTKLNEPVEVFFAKDKAKIKVALVERRLEEFSQVARYEKINAKDKAAFVGQLSMQLEDTHKEIEKLKENNSTSQALKATNDLQSVLSAQSVVLEKIQTAKGENEVENTDDVASVIDTGIQATTEIKVDITDTILNSENAGELEQIIEDQKKEIDEMLVTIKSEKVESVPEESNELSLDITNSTTIDSKLSEIDRNLEIAKTAEETGENIEALELYSQVGQDLGELQKLIQAENKLK